MEEMRISKSDNGCSGVHTCGTSESVVCASHLRFFALTLGRMPTFSLPLGQNIKPPVCKCIANGADLVPNHGKLWAPVWSEGQHDYYAPQPSLEEETFAA